MRFSVLVRRTHLFLALFLTPWVLTYAVSTIAMHHRVLFTGSYEREDPVYEEVSRQEYVPPVAIGDDPRKAARAILRDLEMDGAHGVRGGTEGQPLTIIRDGPFGARRLTYDPAAGSLLIERQRPGINWILEMLHRRRGFQQAYLANDVWAFIVDGVIVAILLWAATGLWLWWEMAKTRRLGAWCLGLGIALFVTFLLTL
ncbi:MAG TPA: PepSY-associated TM helix domain-containing protein [Rhodothermales bacterium]